MIAGGSAASSLRKLRRLGRDDSGLALVEFALTVPLIIAVGCWGVELSYLALTNMRVSQHAWNLADGASRIGVRGGGGVTQVREADINDTLQGLRLAGASIKLGANARVILSSLENTMQSYDTTRVQRIHWQRCFGMRSGAGYDSSYGTTTTSAGTTALSSDAGTPVPSPGMGDTVNPVNAPPDNGVMFVEVNYRYEPLFGSVFLQPRIIHYTASLLVRDNRDYTQIYNPTPAAPRATCNRYTL